MALLAQRMQVGRVVAAWSVRSLAVEVVDVHGRTHAAGRCAGGAAVAFAPGP